MARRVKDRRYLINNICFGTGYHLRRRVGVYSLARHSASFWGEKETPESRTQALRRSLALVVHEVGHAFTIEHWQYRGD